MNRMFKYQTCLVFPLLAVLLLIGCASGAASRITLSVPEQPVRSSSYQPQYDALRVAIAAVISPKETVNSYQGLLTYLSRTLERPVDMVQGKTYAEINDLVRSGSISLAFVCTNSYVQGQEDFGMEAMVIPQVRGKTVYHSYLIVGSDSNIDAFEQLSGKTFAFTDPMSNTGRLVPVYMLSNMGQTPETFFSKYIFTYSHDNSIKAVADRLVDGASIDSLVYDQLKVTNPSLISRSKIIWQSPPYGINPVVVHPSLDPKLKSQLRDLLLNLHEHEEGKAILLTMGIDRFVLPDDRAYDSIREMRARTGKQKTNRP